MRRLWHWLTRRWRKPAKAWQSLTPEQLREVMAAYCQAWKDTRRDLDERHPLLRALEKRD